MRGMLANVLLFSGRQTSMEFKLNDSASGIAKLVEIEADGNCLFGTVSHQLFQDEVNSYEHNRNKTQLRADVVDHIKNDLNAFKHSLNGRLLDMRDDYDVNDITEDDYLHFLDNYLSKDKFWGGSETLLAISKIYCVNVFIFNEKDLCVLMNDATQHYKKSIALAYRIGYIKNDGDKEMIIRNHYDSVFDISSDDIYTSVERIAKISIQNNNSTILIS